MTAGLARGEGIFSPRAPPPLATPRRMDGCSALPLGCASFGEQVAQAVKAITEKECNTHFTTIPGALCGRAPSVPLDESASPRPGVIA